MVFKDKRFECPCCGKLAFDEADNSLSKCPVCYWQGRKEDVMEIDRLDLIEELPLEEARETYVNFGVCDISFLPFAEGARGRFDLRDSSLVIQDPDLLFQVQNGLNNAGWDLHNGLTTGAPDIEQAIVWYERAVEYGSIIAMLNLGNIYEDLGKHEEAYQWYLEAALAGDSAGKFNIANMHYWGWYVKQDYKKAYKYFKQLADQGMPEAINYLGIYAEFGFLEEPDFAKAKAYFEQAVELGDALAATGLGAMYCLGRGVEQDYQKGLELYKLAAGRGDPLAYANIGYCYEVGQGVDRDLDTARFYYSKGAELEHEECLKALERLSTGETVS